MYALNIYYVLVLWTSKWGNPAFCYRTDRPQGHYATFTVSQKLWRAAFASTSPSLCCARCSERGTRSTALSARRCLSQAVFYGKPTSTADTRGERDTWDESEGETSVERWPETQKAKGDRPHAWYWTRGHPWGLASSTQPSTLEMPPGSYMFRWYVSSDCCVEFHRPV